MTMPTSEQALELAALTENLCTIIEHELKILKGARPAAIDTDDAERARLMAMYARQSAAFKNKDVWGGISESAKKRLKSAVERLHTGLKEQSRLLARFRHVSEGMIKAIAQEVAARNAPPVYGKPGAVFRAPAQTVSPAMTYNKTI